MTYSGSLTREQFLFKEAQIVARLLLEDIPEEQISEKIYNDNLFQYPTERMIKNIVSVCLKRIGFLENKNLVQLLAYGNYESAKQVHFYSLIKKERLLREFMFQVIADKYLNKDFSFSKAEVRIFLQRLQEQDDNVASWSDLTMQKINQVIMKILAEVGYLDNIRSTKLNEVLLDYELERGIIDNGDTIYLPIFNRFVK